MPAKSPPTNNAANARLEAIALGIRGQRLSLGISATVAAHAAGVSRVCWRTGGAWPRHRTQASKKPVEKVLNGVLPKDQLQSATIHFY